MRSAMRSSLLNNIMLELIVYSIIAHESNVLDMEH